MKIAKNRIIVIVISIFLMFSMTASLMLIPNANAHTPGWDIPTFAYIAATPNPIGVGQTATIGFWLSNVYPEESLANNYRFNNFELTITAPNGDVTPLTFPTATPDSFATDYLIPTQTGTYTFTFTFPGQNDTTANDSPTSPYLGDYYLPSNATCNLTVTQTPVPSAIAYPLPTAYWTRPINGEMTSWNTIASNYVDSEVAAQYFGAVRYVAGAAAPNTGHIMWTDPIEFGGYTGTEPDTGYTDTQAQNSGVSASTFFDGRSYQDKFNYPIIIDGNLYFALPVADLGEPNTATIQGGYTDINLETGQTVWTKNMPVYPTFGIVINVDTPNQYGAFGFLVAVSGSTWTGYDAYTGDWDWNITGVPSGWNNIFGPEGEPLIYTLHVGTTGDWLALWNFTDCMADGALNYIQESGSQWGGRIVNNTAEGSNAYSWNVTIPLSENIPQGTTMLVAFNNDLALCSTVGPGALGGPEFGGIVNTGTAEPLTTTMCALNLNPNNGAIGAKIWQKTYTTPDNETFEINSADPVSNVFIMSTVQTLQFYGFNMNSTGDQIWGPVGDQSGYAFFSIDIGTSAENAYCDYSNGNFYVTNFGGIVYCFSEATGHQLWSYGNGVTPGNDTASGFNTPYGNYPCQIVLIADGMVYTATGNHGNGNPYYKGEMISCLNATTGALIWSEQAEYEVGGFEAFRMPVADGDIAFLNCYTMETECIGRGPSATTVQTPLNGVPKGNLVIEGTVMDTSAGTQQTQQKADFPNGVPCVSDASESAWMEYVYGDLPMPTNVTGVPVTLTAIDPNGNYIVLGTAYTDSSGSYSLEINTNNLVAGTGLYKVTASFAGSNSYWGSSAESTFAVTSAEATPAPTAASLTGLASNTTVMYAVVAMIIVFIVGIALVLVFVTRKHP